MSSFDIIEQELQRYNTLASHQKPELAHKLAEVQSWQKKRMETLHLPLFSESKHVLMGRYFLDRLYGGPDFPVLAQQFERILGYAHKVEKIAPASAIATATQGIQLAVLAISLDETIAAWLLHSYPDDSTVTDDMMIEALKATDQTVQRNVQMDLLDQLGVNLDKYMNSFIVQSAFKLAKGSAYRRDLNAMYDFVSDGFAAMKPLKSTKAFIAQFTQNERLVMQQIIQNKPNPLVIG